MHSKRGYEFSFAWLFALFVGAVVIFLAIYVATQIVQTRQFERESAEAREIGVLLTPVETNLEEGKFATLYVTEETKILNDCEIPDPSDPFGSQKLSLSIRPSLGQEWQNTSGVASSFHNKYLFSGSQINGKDEFYILSKPFNFPFKVADLVMLWSDQEVYCFVNPPQQIERELSELNMTNTYVNSCPAETTKRVCFPGSANCDIKVYMDQPNSGRVEKNGDRFSYVTSFGSDKYGMMYAAIFSSSLEDYNCQIERLLSRTASLAEVYKNKADYIHSQCSFASIQQMLSDYQTILQSTVNQNTYQKAEDINNANRMLSCKLY
jgi:hypothetical protein